VIWKCKISYSDDDNFLSFLLEGRVTSINFKRLKIKAAHYDFQVESM
jgi:hypothetical protein